MRENSIAGVAATLLGLTASAAAVPTTGGSAAGHATTGDSATGGCAATEAASPDSAAGNATLRGIGIEHRGEIAEPLRGMHEHAAELAAAQHAQRRTGQHDGSDARPAAQRGRLRRLTSGRRSSPAPLRSGVRGTLRAVPRRVASFGASMATANSAALAAPAVPMANVATGTPLGICTIACSESTPCRCRLGTGTPSTGTVVLDASMPGRWAAPPAPAMIALQAAAAARLGIREHFVGHAVGRDHPRFMRDAELRENLRRRAAGCPSRCWSP